MPSKKELLKELDRLEADYQSLVRSYDKKCQQTNHQAPFPVKSRRVLILSFDLWPLKDWLRLSINPFQPGHYFQFCIGPFRVDFFEDCE